jgi:hypothetical protein
MSILVSVLLRLGIDLPRLGMANLVTEVWLPHHKVLEKFEQLSIVERCRITATLAILFWVDRLLHLAPPQGWEKFYPLQYELKKTVALTGRNSNAERQRFCEVETDINVNPSCEYDRPPSGCK